MKRGPKPRPKKCGIYAIHSSVNGRTYVGHSVDISTRWSSHRARLRNGKHPNQHLQNAWIKYKEKAFEFFVLEECPRDQLLIREQHHIDAHPVRYNIAPVAGSNLGSKRTPETRKKMSASLIGNTRWVGKVHSLETKAKMSTALKGRKVTPEHRTKISAAMKGNTNCAGRVMTDETRAKISASLTGRKHTPPEATGEVLEP